MRAGVEWVLEEVREEVGEVREKVGEVREEVGEVREEVGEVREEVVVLDSRARAAVAARGGLESRSSRSL